MKFITSVIGSSMNVIKLIKKLSYSFEKLKTRKITKKYKNALFFSSMTKNTNKNMK